MTIKLQPSLFLLLAGVLCLGVAWALTVSIFDSGNWAAWLCAGLMSAVAGILAEKVGK